MPRAWRKSAMAATVWPRRASIIPRWKKVAASSVDLRQPGEGIGIVRILEECLLVLRLRRGEPAAIEVEVGEQHSRVGAVLGNRTAGFDRLLHRVDRARDVAEQFSRVRHPR